MEKTKLGISVGLLGAAIFAATLFGGYVPAILLAGYVLLREENEWLKKSAIKAIAISMCFSFGIYLIDLIPDVLNWILSIINIFGTNFYLSFIGKVVGVITSGLSLLRTIIFLLLIYKSLTQGTVKVPVVDDVLNKYM